MKNKRFSKFFAGKGFYIALILCVAVVGLGTWAIFGFTDTGLRVTAEMPNQDEDVFNPQTPVISPGSNPDDNSGENPQGNQGESPVQTAAPTLTPAPGVSAKPAPKSFMWPVSGDISMPYSVDALIYNPTMADWRTHAGIDINSELGTSVSAVADGTVTNVEKGGMLGTTVTIEHGGELVSIYANLEEDVLVATGDSVEMGDIIGKVGQTSVSEAGMEPHLHLEMTVNGVSVNPLDYLPA